jgi:hypothetical protein
MLFCPPIVIDVVAIVAVMRTIVSLFACPSDCLTRLMIT